MKANKKLDPNNNNHWITHAEYMKRENRSAAKYRKAVTPRWTSCYWSRFTVWHAEMLIAACLGAALALGVVLVVGMLTTEWTW